MGTEDTLTNTHQGDRCGGEGRVMCTVGRDIERVKVEEDR